MVRSRLSTSRARSIPPSVAGSGGRGASKVRASVASGGLDSLPHNGAVITLLSICQLTHRQSYLDIFMVSVVVPLLALAVLLALGTAFGSF